MQDRTTRSKLTRRSLVAGAAAGTLMATTGGASAQRCPAEPPPRAKGPLVWLDMDQKDLDEAYDQSVYAFNARTIEERRRFNNEIVQSRLPKPERIAYGPSEIE